jgi:putative DNA primase/helicase
MVPRELYQYKQWVCWSRVRHAGRYIKLPFCPATGKPASCVDPATWGSYRQARAMMFRNCWDGVGFVFTAGDPYVGVDLDRCREESGELCQWAGAVVENLRSFSEYSPSGNGVHIIVRASLPEGGRHRAGGIEIYDSGRYFTMTGEQIGGTPLTVEQRQAEIDHLQAALSSQSSGKPTIVRPSMSDTDEGLLSRARRARNASKFNRLWAGDLSDYDGDHSRADAGLCSMLAFYTGCDAVRIDRLFRSSALYRAKWDRSTGGSTYGRVTIDAAIEYAGTSPQKGTH